MPELERLAARSKPFFLFLRHMDPHAPYLPPAAVRAHVLSRQRERPEQHARWSR